MTERTTVNRIRLVLIDAPGLFRATLCRLLAQDPGLEMAGEFNTPAEALEFLRDSTADVVLADLDACVGQETEFIAAARQAGYGGQFLLVSQALNARKSAIAFRLGAGVFLKAEAPDRLVEAIKRVAAGEVWVDREVILSMADNVIDQRSDKGVRGNSLEDRERDVLLGILGGLSNRQIGDKMSLAESSVKNVVLRLFSKARVRSRSGLVRVAMDGSWGAARDIVRTDPVSHGRSPL